MSIRQKTTNPCNSSSYTENMEHEYHLSCQRSKTIDKKACVLLFYIFVLFYGFLSIVGAKIRINSKIPKFLWPNVPKSPNLLLYYLLVVVFGYLVLPHFSSERHPIFANGLFIVLLFIWRGKYSYNIIRKTIYSRFSNHSTTRENSDNIRDLPRFLSRRRVKKTIYKK